MEIRAEKQRLAEKIFSNCFIPYGAGIGGGGMAGCVRAANG